jgi:hypothetical protein
MMCSRQLSWADFGRFIADETAKWRRAGERLGIPLN